MRFILLFLLLILGVFSLSQAQGTYEDCCLRYAKAPKHNLLKKVSSYRKQELDGGCNLPAVVFKLKGGRLLCANPKLKWVVSLQTKLDNKWRKPSMDKKPTRKKGSSG
ncbi:C-C motif chemokine 25 [Electrophorus electricus]|uniref:Chemokine interleukin-8-like domain-containing protein n=1 Tax=Electrophorus electricus TaxID=8005 RepID=A0A4W4HHL5_ELEEL|nr:C-C motif chemokine 25 [Electrophorus electricus]